VDLVVPQEDGIASYQYSYATNFDQSFTDFELVPRSGKKSLSVVENGFVDSRYKNQSRFLFDPSDYSIDDNAPFFVKVTPIDNAGNTGTTSSMHLILPYNTTPNRGFILSGSVLPMQVNDFNLINTHSSNDLYFSMEPGGYELLVKANSAYEVRKIYSDMTQLFLRGSGGAASISAMFTLLNNPN